MFAIEGFLNILTLAMAVNVVILMVYVIIEY